MGFVTESDGGGGRLGGEIKPGEGDCSRDDVGPLCAVEQDKDHIQEG